MSTTSRGLRAVLGSLAILVALARCGVEEAQQPVLLGVAPVVVPVAASAPSDERVLTPALKAAGVTELDLLGPHDPPVDRFHPDGQVTPALGGRAIMHVSAEPPTLNFALGNTGIIRWLLLDLHAALIQFSPVTWESEPDLATSWDVEDTLVLTGGRGEDDGNILFGRVEEQDDAYVVTSGSASNPIERTVVPKADVASLERGTVFTFRLREGVLWHDGHPFDAQDVAFSMDIYKNPHVDCDQKRFRFDGLARHEIVAPGVVRFFWKEQYFGTEGSFGSDFMILPSHRYNLRDPDNPAYDPALLADPEALAVAEGAHINGHPDNREGFVGLGPYRLVDWQPQQYLEAARFDGYWDKDPAHAGYLDRIRWRVVQDDDAAFQALLNGELDVFYRVTSTDFFGEATQGDDFTAGFYKAFTYTGLLNYLGWNVQRPQLSDPRVRRALAQAFDVAAWRDTNYKGYAIWTTSSFFFFGPAYNTEVAGYAFDPEAAEELLADAGWYDRDGNGIVDKDGQELVIEALMPSGNKASESMLQAIQAAYARVGVRLEILPLEWATMRDRILDRDFDACNRASSITSTEGDPFQQWHGSEAVGRTSNFSGLDDPLVDELIEAGRRELDDETRWAIWHRLHARIYELQPLLFGWNVPRKLAFKRALHGVKLYKFDPGFQMRDLYYAAGTPGTRPLEQR